ncbi:hypothetical protein PMIN06_009877 [Paraphaeosphaeria minitans]
MFPDQNKVVLKQGRQRWHEITGRHEGSDNPSGVASNGKTGVGRPYAWGPIQLATAQKTQQLPSSTENVLHGIQKPTRLAPSKPGNCATTNLRTSDLKWSSTQPSMDTALRRRV